MTPIHSPVLIVGAGPTGLVLALGLAKRGVAFRIIDDGDGPGEFSRAMVVHARTLEFYQQFGFADEVVNSGVKMESATLREADGKGSHDVTSVSFADLGGTISPFPFALCYPQDDHERFLVQKLTELGVNVEWKTRLTGFTDDGTVVRATLQLPNGETEEATADYVAGCDGAHSVVRQTLKIDFPGGTYDQLFYVADVQYESGFNTDLVITLGERIFVLSLPVRSTEMQRLIGLVPPELSDRKDLTFEDVRAAAEGLIGKRVKTTNWFATYRVHHRVAATFRVGRAFLAGDAGHIHSPAGGQGMNTGIGDAINLGWKLAEVIQKRANPSILDSYEGERIAFARSLVETTDRAFTPLVATGLKGEAMRRIIAPLFFTIATRIGVTRHAFFKVLSQTRVHYGDSQLSAGKAGNIHGGDRLPWVPRPPSAGNSSLASDNFAPLQSLDWQVHVYGTANGALRNSCADLGLALHEFEYTTVCDDVGFARDALYLVRPDGYVALATQGDDTDALDSFVDRIGLRLSA